MIGITKRFSGVAANEGVDFTASWGELHALIGENGAGKSTLMNLLYGLHIPDSGEIKVGGDSVRIADPRDAIALGIGMVHQHFMLIPAFTALENIVLGAETAKLGLTDFRAAEAKVLATGERFGLRVDLHKKVADLSVSAQQKVEILKALYRDARILILDEPTSVLAPQEAESLFEMLRRMVAEGMCVILISHKLNDVISYADRVTVLRRGRVVASLETGQTCPEELTRMMVGEDVPTAEPQKASVVGEGAVLKVRDLSVRGRSGRALDSVSFDIRPGEVLGVAGVDGNGQRELAEALVGLTRSTGTITLGGVDISGMSVRGRLEQGMAYVPEDRRFALAPDFSILDNSILGFHRGFAYHGILDLDEMVERADELIGRNDIRASGPGAPVKSLSGGNRQKLVLGRALIGEPTILIACQPTMGLDVHATAEIHRRLLAECTRGAGVLLISYDLDEILALSHRVLVMYQGRVAGVLTREEASREKVGAMMLGAKA